MKGVLCHLHPLGVSPRRSVADSGACVPKVLPAAELEGVLAGLIIAICCRNHLEARRWAMM